jgi:hypothetical protein
MLAPALLSSPLDTPAWRHGAAREECLEKLRQVRQYLTLGE